MPDAIKQKRVTLTRLQVAGFASHETLCFSATVLFDGKPIAEAQNEGSGGATFLRPRREAVEQFSQAEAFAKTLPPLTIERGRSKAGPEKFTIPLTLESLVDHIANSMADERRLRIQFKRDLSNKALYVKGGRVFYLKGVNLRTVADKPALFASLRAKEHPEAILAELPEDEAFALWKRYVVKKEDSP